MNADGGTLTPIQKILIVDDKPENLTALRNVLSDLSVTCVSAESGNQALAATLHHDFALAILDVQMPGMDGYETTRRIREAEALRGRGAPLPVVAITAHALDRDRQRCLDAGMNDFISKPFDADELLLSVARWARP